MANSKGRRRRFGAVRKLPSGRWQARYLGPDGLERRAPETFETKTDADVWLTQIEADMTRGDWLDPDAGAVNFGAYALRWVAERKLSATTDELYYRMLRLHILPTFRHLDLAEITPPRVRTWRAERLEATGETTVAKSYRLLKAILQTATDDELIRRNPCRIKGAGKEEAEERPIATIEQVDALADAMGARWRLMVYLAAYASLRPEEQAELRRPDVVLPDVPETLKRSRESAQGPILLRISRASPELTTGKRVTGDPKSQAGKRTVVLPGFLYVDVRRHLDWFAAKEPNGLLFVGERGAPFRRSTFGRKWRKARDKVGLPPNFRFYDLRHTGNTLAADTGAKLKDLMVRAGQSSQKAQLIYQHSTLEHQQRIADDIDAHVRARRSGAEQDPEADPPVLARSEA
ncbi:tyrosine-type recombinase/integrase [Streptantibioticus ferralitis]|uniref:Tyrosine-type recombinase/integrase n=1 Tax=Streptantibioticus ferralitis TaxID=236510 RepID=A0ABT5Z454_9ACTN|nr:tyrosine-type recombinase/integrase [Streptantibioticus ferralitis]MDF2258611.1 tyrosine-type recombinase/integrase [Streptantibioticus ferralitis]